MKAHKKLRAAGKILLAIAMAAALFLFLQALLMPKYVSGVHEGRLIGEYYAERKSHDVIFLGDCEVYGNISPLALWESYGITSYIRGSPQQLVWQSYYLLEETLLYEKPKVVVFSVAAMKYDAPFDEAYNRLTLDGMRLSVPKLRSVWASMTDGEDWITYVLPILRYHDRWRELGADDVKHLLSAGNVSHNGFVMRCDVKPVTIIPSGPKLPSYQFGPNSYEYLDKMARLCRDNGIGLVLMKAPSLYPHWYSQWDEQMSRYASEHGLSYINTIELTGEIGLDFNTDTYNAGLNLNLAGAEKFSKYLGEYLLERFELADNRADERLSERWGAKAADYYAMKEAQLADIAAGGAVETFTYVRGW